MFQFDHSLDLPIDCDLIAELGIDRHTVREIAEDERAIRCPERGAVFPRTRVRGPRPGPGGGIEAEKGFEEVSGRGFGRVSRPPAVRNPSSSTRA